MTEKTSDAPPEGDDPGPVATLPAAPAVLPTTRLPTLQHHALCKIFDRPVFGPAEVAALGYRRLQQADGIGQKGLAEITAWLKLHGFELKPLDMPTPPCRQVARSARKNIEQAVRLLRTHGYLVQSAAGDSMPEPVPGDPA